MRHSLPILGRRPEYPTASELHRAAECVAPWALGLPTDDEPAGEWAEMGRAMHAGAEALAKGATIDDAMHVVREVHEIWPGGWDKAEAIFGHVGAPLIGDFRSRRNPESWFVEQGIAWRRTYVEDVLGFPTVPKDEAELITRAPGERRRGWFTGSADLAYVRADGVVVVVDWKFGPSTQRLGDPAEDHAQLWTLALGLVMALGVSAARPTNVVTRVELRYVTERGIAVDATDITQEALGHWGDVLAALAARIDAASDADPRRNHGCGHCRSRNHCPSWQILEETIAAEMGATIDATVDVPRTPAEAKAYRDVIRGVEHALPRWKEHYRAWHLQHPEGLPVGLGLIERAKKQEKRKLLTTPEALAEVERVAGPDAIEVKTTRHSSLARIERAVRDKVGEGIKSASDRKKAKDSAEAVALEQLTAVGAVVPAGNVWAIGLYRSDGSEVAVVDRMGEENE